MIKRFLRVVSLLAFLCAVELVSAAEHHIAKTTSAVSNANTRVVWFLAMDEHGLAVTNLDLSFNGVATNGARYFKPGKTGESGLFCSEFTEGASYVVCGSPSVGSPYYFRTNGTIDAVSGLTSNAPICLDVKNCKRLRGKVVGPEGNPMSGVDVWAGVWGDSDPMAAGDSRYSSEDGSFDLNLVRARDKIVLGAKKSGFTCDQVTIPARDYDDLLLKMRPDPRAMLQVRILDAAKKGMPVIKYSGNGMLQGTGSNQLGFEIENGETRLVGIKPDTYRFVLLNLEWSKGYHVTNSVVVVTAGMDPKIDLMALPIPETTVLVKEKASGAPVPGVVVKSGRTYPRKTTTDENGMARIQLLAGDEARADVADSRFVGPSKAVPLLIGQTNVVMVTRRMPFKGIVIGPEGEKIDKAMIVGLDGRYGAETGKDGQFVLEGLPDMPLQLVASAEGYAPQVELISPPWKERTIKLSKGVQVLFDVRLVSTAVDGEAVETGAVVLLDSATRVPLTPIWIRGETQKEGLHLNPGRYEAVWMGKKAQIDLGRIDIEQAGTKTLEIRSPRP